MSNKQNGFTLVEVVAVMVIVVVLAASAIPRMTGAGEFAARMAADRLAAALQYAQTLAQRQGVATSVIVAANAPNLTVVQNNLAVSMQSESYNGEYKVDFHPEVSATPSSTVTFGTDGIPGSGTAFSVKENGVTRFTVTVEATGFVYLAAN